MIHWKKIDKDTPKDRPIRLYRPAAEIGTQSRFVCAIWWDELGEWVWPDRIYDETSMESYSEVIDDGDIFSSSDFTHWQEIVTPYEQSQ